MTDAAAFVRSLGKDRAPAGVYVLYGEEPQLIDEARAAIQSAGNFGSVERASLELFGDSEKPDSHIAESPGAALFGGGACFYEITAHAPPTGIRSEGEGGGAYKILQGIVKRIKPPDALTVSFYGLERRHHRAKWFLELTGNAEAAISCSRLTAAQTAKWCEKWAKEMELQMSEDAVNLLASQTEGNLAAAKQCLQKMRLHGGGGSEEEVAEALSGGARFNIFHLVDAALAGKGKQSLAILNVLWDLQEPPPLILWAASAAASGVLAAKRGQYPAGLAKPAAAAAKQIAQKVREESVMEVLHRAAHADRVIKGIDAGDIKIALTDTVAALACLRRGNTISVPKLQVK